MMKKIIVLAFLLCVNLPVWAQVDYPTQYQNAKEFFRQGKYNLAMESFKPLVAYDQKNQYSPYASFYYALAAYKQGYHAVAKDMFQQIKTVHPKWDKMEEVNLWLAKVYLEDHDYFQGIKILNSIQDKKLTEQIENLKAQSISEVADTETLKMMLEEFPKDAVAAKYLARALAKDLSDEENKKELEDLIDRFKLERSEFIPEAPKTFHKDRYAVSVLLPFMLETLDGSPGKKRNQIVLDFYEGMKIALDTLNRKGPKISLRVYDTDKKSNDDLNRLLETEELKNSDLVIGLLNEIVQQFSLQNQVNVVNPFSNNTDLIGTNPYAYLFQPASETLARKSAEYIADHAGKDVCMIFYGASKKDSVLAATFAEKAAALGQQIVAKEMVTREDAARIMTILTTATEFDEFKVPTEFTLEKDSLGSIFVATDDPLIYTKVISSMETRGDSVLVLGSENWIDDTAVPFEKYQTLGITFAAPNFVSPDNGKKRAFISKYLSAYGKVPSNLSQLGYEMMMFFGNQLKTNGVYFQDGLNKEEFIPGHLSQGFKYQFSRDNQVIPFVKFENGVLKLIEVR